MRIVLRRRESIHGLSFGLMVTVFSGMHLCIKDIYWFVKFFVAASILFVSVIVLSQSHVDLSYRYVVLSDLYVELSDLYVDLSLIQFLEN